MLLGPRGIPAYPLPCVLAFSSTGQRERADSPGDPCLVQGILESIGERGQETTTRTGPGGEAPLGLSYLPLKMESGPGDFTSSNAIKGSSNR